ncbi:MAG TPA: asparagine synthase (glutamine-hydrolyzing) [Hypericibacter adhaerens]|jgi:asparagine synthase (glutamine-hydrolysing)|uniref:asparagine synthase (glutamine-hydrolyzing) n=1 Tax=Hypericibacter adhaerens TaxID=2602016 RepID=UPI002B6F6CA7|nr:asparagine synthase (glutamine-hydrolyzing) [Hypericibacter adhaerens]HWA42741.1 asparagine synthase (glutamine-hydrolyzing) [Hypericibacter adhaerens]
MCGIFGAVTNPAVPLDPQAGLAALRHRGPDSEGVATEELRGRQVLLGHTRLAILDLSPAGHQPMASRDGHWLLSYNGEAYNHLALRQDLAGGFRGHSDTETLAESLAARGLEASLSRLDGMFAFAALDRKEGKLHLVRDAFGIKPVYYMRLPQGIAFASEVRALLALTGISPPVDEDALQCFLTLRFVPSPRTLWQGIHRLPAGHRLEYDLVSGELALARYVEPVAERYAGSREDAIERYHDILGEAVERQLLSDVPVGVLLSGGIDSALVAALAKEKGHRLPCYTVGFGAGHKECEIEDARETAGALGLPFVAVNVAPEDLMATLDQVIDSLEEPIVSTSALAIWHLIGRMRQDVTVALSGQGSDEPWGGYTRYQNEVLRRLLPSPAVAGWVGRAMAGYGKLPEAVQRALRSLPIESPAERFREAYALFTGSQRQALTGRADDGQALGDIGYWLDWSRGTGREPVETMMSVDARTCLPDDWLLYTDKISMAYALEVRVPILDLEVVRFVESLPRAFRLAPGRRKIVHKMMARRFLSPAIVNRKKKGFPIPFGAWSRDALRPRVEGILLETLPRTGLFNRVTIEMLWRRHLAQEQPLDRQIYALFILGSWFERFQAGKGRGSTAGLASAA